MHKIQISDNDLHWLSIKHIHDTFQQLISIYKKVFSEEELDAFYAFEDAWEHLLDAYNKMMDIFGKNVFNKKKE